MTALSTRYADSFKEWHIVTEDEEVAGDMRMRWSFRDDWSEWDVQLRQMNASIRQKWKDDPNLWEIRCAGITVNARTAWPGEFGRWKLSDGRNQFNWQASRAVPPAEWTLDNPPSGGFQLYPYWEGDPREWVVRDELPDEVSLAMRVAMMFLAVHFSSPKY